MKCTRNTFIIKKCKKFRKIFNTRISEKLYGTGLISFYLFLLNINITYFIKKLKILI